EREEWLGHRIRAKQQERRLQKKEGDHQLGPFKLKLLGQPPCLPRRQETDDDREEFRRRVTEMRREGVQKSEERAAPHADEIDRVLPPPAREQEMRAAVLLVAVLVKQGECHADSSGDPEPHGRPESGLSFSVGRGCWIQFSPFDFFLLADFREAEVEDRVFLPVL